MTATASQRSNAGISRKSRVQAAGRALAIKLIQSKGRQENQDIESVLLKWFEEDVGLAMQGLAMVGTDTTWRTFLRIVTEGDSSLHKEALHALALSGSESVREELMNRMDRFPVELKGMALRCLSTGWPEDEQVKSIISKILDDETPYKPMLHASLKTLHLTKMHRNLKTSALQGDPQLVETAASSLTRICDEKAVELLRELSSQRERMTPEARLRLASALETVNDPTVPRIIEEVEKELGIGAFLDLLSEIRLRSAETAVFLENLIVKNAAKKELHRSLKKTIEKVISRAPRPQALASALSKKLTSTLRIMMEDVKKDRRQISKPSTPEAVVVCHALDYLLHTGDPELVEDITAYSKPEVSGIPPKLGVILKAAVNGADAQQIAGLKAMVEVLTGRDPRLKPLLHRLIKGMTLSEPMIQYVVEVGAGFMASSSSAASSKTLLDIFKMLWPMRDSKNKSLRSVMRALSEIADASSVEAANMVLEERFPPLMEIAIISLGRRGDGPAVNKLRELTREKSIRTTKLWLLSVLSAIETANPVDELGITDDLLNILKDNPGDMVESKIIGLAVRYASFENLPDYFKYCSSEKPPRIQSNAFEGLIAAYKRYSKPYDSSLIDMAYGLLKDAPDNHRLRAVIAEYLMDADEEAGKNTASEMLKNGGSSAQAILSTLTLEKLLTLSNSLIFMISNNEIPDIVNSIENILFTPLPEEEKKLESLREDIMLTLLGLKNPVSTDSLSMDLNLDDDLDLDDEDDSYDSLLKMRKEHTNLKRKAEYELARKFERELTVFFTDISGYTERSSRSELSDIMAMLHDYDAICLPHIEANEGRLIKKIGDAFMATFETATGAVVAGLKIQAGVREYNMAQPPEKKLRIRVGINTGSVMERDNDVYGQTVNIASRVESLCEPGEVFFTASTRVKLSASVVVQEIGHRNVKGEPKPVHVFKAVSFKE